jgi:hypothetical protein
MRNNREDGYAFRKTIFRLVSVFFENNQEEQC